MWPRIHFILLAFTFSITGLIALPTNTEVYELSCNSEGSSPITFTITTEDHMHTSPQSLDKRDPPVMPDQNLESQNAVDRFEARSLRAKTPPVIPKSDLSPRTETDPSIECSIITPRSSSSESSGFKMKISDVRKMFDGSVRASSEGVEKTIPVMPPNLEIA